MTEFFIAIGIISLPFVVAIIMEIIRWVGSVIMLKLNQ